MKTNQAHLLINQDKNLRCQPSFYPLEIFYLFSINIRLESHLVCLFQKQGLHLPQKGFGLLATFKLSKYSFLFFKSLTIILGYFLYLHDQLMLGTY